MYPAGIVEWRIGVCMWQTLQQEVGAREIDSLNAK